MQPANTTPSILLVRAHETCVRGRKPAQLN
jgi:hypothetical protein